MIVTVTMNSALDRILTVPNFQRGQRHRASEKLTQAGGKGIIVARALKRLGIPVVATGLVGGRNGRRILEELSEEAVLNDLVRIDDESRTSTAVIDPTSGEYTEIIEWGPLVHPEELDTLREKLDYLARGAEMVVFCGSLPRGIDESFYADMIRELNRRGISTVLDTEGEPLRLGIEAEPELATPNQFEAEGLVGQELNDEDDFVVALDTLVEMGARNVLVKHDRGCLRAPAPGEGARPADAVPRRGAGRRGRLAGRRGLGASGGVHRGAAGEGAAGGGAATGRRGRQRVDARRRLGPVRSARGSAPRWRSRRVRTLAARRRRTLHAGAVSAPW